MKFVFQDEGHVLSNCIFHILAVQSKFLPLQFLFRGIRMHIPLLAGVQDKRISKNTKITHILSIGDFQVALNCVFRNITKKLFFLFLSMLFFAFLYISKMQVLKSSKRKPESKSLFLIKNIEMLLCFPVLSFS